MDQDDKILQLNLKTYGINIDDFDALTSFKLIGITVVCLKKLLATAPAEKTGFIDARILENALKLSASSSRPMIVKTCTTLVDYMSKLEYRQSLGFNNFLYPDPRTLRKVLNFLVESIAKYEEKDTVKAAQLSVFQMNLLKAMRNWTSRPWLLPQFQVPSKHPTPLKAIHIQKDARLADYNQAPPRVRTAKIKRVFEVLNSPSFKEFSLRDMYLSGGISLKQVNEINDIKLQRVVKVKHEENLLHEEDDDDEIERLRAKKKAQAELAKALQEALRSKKGRVDDDVNEERRKGKGEGEMGFMGELEGGGEGRKRANSLSEILNRRKEEESKLKTIQDTQDSVFQQKIQFESEDVQGTLHSEEVGESEDKTAAGKEKKKKGKGMVSGSGGEIESQRMEEENQTAGSGAGGKMSGAGQDGGENKEESALQKKQRMRKEQIQEQLEQLKIEKEGQVNELETRLEKMQEKLGRAEEQITAKETETQELTTELQDLEKEYRELKGRTETKHALLKALQKGGQAVSSQQQKVRELEEELASLEKQWDDFKKPLVEEIHETQEEVKEKRVEYQFKKDQVMQMRADISRAGKEMQYKEELMAFMQDEYAKAPKDLTRNVYTRKINDIIGQLKTQEKQIAGTVEDIKDLQGKTGHLVHAVKMLDQQLEDLVFQQAKKETVSKNIYKDLQSFKQVFDVLVTALQQQVNVKNSLREVEKKTMDMRIKFKELNVESLENDIRNVKKENDMLERKIAKK